MKYGERVFSFLLLVYPAGFRRRYGDDLMAFFRAVLERTKSSGGFVAQMRFWLKTLTDLMRVATSERIASISGDSVDVWAPQPSGTRTISRLTASAGVRTLLHEYWCIIRGIVRNPGYTAVAVLSLALGIGANTALFSIHSSVFLRQLPVEDPGSLVDIYTNAFEGDVGLSYAASSYSDFLSLQEQTRDVFDGIVLYDVAFVFHESHDESGLLFGEKVTPDYFEVLGVSPVLGRAFVPIDRAIDATPAAVVSHAFWQSQFGGEPDVLDRSIRLSGKEFTVVGVAPKEFGGLFPLRTDVWYPITHDPLLNPGAPQSATQGTTGLWIKGRLMDGVTTAQAREVLGAVSDRLAEAHPGTDSEMSLALVPTGEVSVHPELDGIIRGFTMSLMAMVGLVLFIACTNLAGMLLARGKARRRETGIRLALGASRLRLVCQQAAESTTLAIIGGLVGLGLAYLSIQVILAVRPQLMVPIQPNIGIDGNVLLFTLAVSLLTGLMIGLLPASKNIRHEFAIAVKGECDARARRLGPVRIRSLLVVTQVAVSAVLLICAGPFLRSLTDARSVDAGYSPREGVIINVRIDESRHYAETGRSLLEELKTKITDLPDVLSATYYGRHTQGQSIATTNAYPQLPNEQVSEGGVDVDYVSVGPDYFSAFGVPILAGRSFHQDELLNGEQVVIVNNTLSRTLWPGEKAVGQQLRLGADEHESSTVIGVVGDGKHITLGENVRPLVYRPHSGLSAGYTQLAVESTTDGRDLLQSIQSEIDRLPGQHTVLDITTVSEQLELILLLPKVITTVLAGLGLLALALGMIGLYGLVAHDASRRTREVGIRMSVGAHRLQVLCLIAWDGTKLVLVSTAAGILLAILFANFLGPMLYSVSPLDSGIVVAVMILFLSVGLVATLVPAMHASSVNPVEALRHE